MLDKVSERLHNAAGMRISWAVRGLVLAMALAVAAGCARRGGEPAQPVETFSWCAQKISFAPPSPRWYREADNGGGMLGVRFVLTGGLGECITVATYHSLAERDRREALTRLISRRDSLGQREFMRELSLARAPTDDPLSEREGSAAQAVNAALDRAVTHYFSDGREFVRVDLQDALEAASSYELTLADILPRIRLRPERMQEPERWRIGYERDTTLAGHAAFASDDTLITPDRPLLYREIYWVVNRCAFKAVYQGTKANVETFDRVVSSIAFPASTDAPPR